MTLESVAEQTGANVVWLRRLARAGRLPGAVKIGQVWFVDTSAVEVVRQMPRRRRGDG